MRQNIYWLIKNAVSDTLCEELINKGEAKGLTDGEIIQQITPTTRGAVCDPTIRISTITWLDSEECPEWFNFISRYVQPTNEEAGWNIQLDDAEHLQLTRYDVDGHYGWHVDSVGERHDSYDAPDSFVDKKVRKLTCVGSLNNNFTGGELELSFLTKDNKQEVLTLLLEKGSLIFFPSNTLHRVKPVTSGVRYTAANWFIGDPWQ
jgi:PKHD-type hydroxylase